MLSEKQNKETLQSHQNLGEAFTWESLLFVYKFHSCVCTVTGKGNIINEASH